MWLYATGFIQVPVRMSGARVDWPELCILSEHNTTQECT